jgi:hypothetical protein
MLITPPECWTLDYCPCFEEDWHRCNRCGKLICAIHGDLYAVRHSGTNEYRGSDQMCSECIEQAWRMGEISSGEEHQYINLR